MLFHIKEFSQLIFVKSHDEFIVHIDDRHAHLATLLDHLLPLYKIRLHIKGLIGDLVLLEKILCKIAIVTCRR